MRASCYEMLGKAFLGYILYLSLTGVKLSLLKVMYEGSKFLRNCEHNTMEYFCCRNRPLLARSL